MASQQAVVALSRHANLCPSPLDIRKKTPRATIYRRILRKSIYQPYYDSVYGPLDDIIDEITGDLWASPLECSFESPLRDWHNALKATPTCTITPLPVSRIPSDQPLTIRKNRNSRSTASDSSAGYSMAFSRKSSQNDPLAEYDGSAGAGYSERSITPWPLFEVRSHADASGPGPSDHTVGTDYTFAQQALEGIQHTVSSGSLPTKRRTSRMRLFTDALSRLRRAGTEDTAKSNVPSHTASSPRPLLARRRAASKGEPATPRALADEVQTVSKEVHARNGSKVSAVVARVTARLPSTRELCVEQAGNEGTSEVYQSTPSTLRAAISILPEVKVLSAEDQQDLWVAVEIEGVLHNRRPLPNMSIDLAIIVDNGYYVSKSCLSRALDATTSALYHLNRGDKAALYTTHCTHTPVTGVNPDMIYPLRPFGKDTAEIFRDLTMDIAKCGKQKWEPPRPNPSMADVVLAVAKSLESRESRQGRTHLILLSPVANDLHHVSIKLPDLRVYQINPAVLPRHASDDIQGRDCAEDCCKNVFVSNWAHYQSLSTRIKQIIRYARSEKPIGEISNIHVDIRPRQGCEVLEYEGATDLNCLRLGQVHAFFVHVRVTRHEVQELDLDSTDPIINSSLDVNNLGRDLQNVKSSGAFKAHILSVQVMHSDSLHAQECWTYTEAQLLIFKSLGSLEIPLDMTMELYKRQLFFKLSKLEAKSAEKDIERVASYVPEDKGDLQKLIERMVKEAARHQKVSEYELRCRQTLPSCPGPIGVATTPHEWLMEKWDAKKNKRMGMAIV